MVFICKDRRMVHYFVLEVRRFIDGVWGGGGGSVDRHGLPRRFGFFRLRRGLSRRLFLGCISVGNETDIKADGP
jgi:hypothetical protein